MFKCFSNRKKKINEKNKKDLKSIDTIFADTKIINHIELDQKEFENINKDESFIKNIKKKRWLCC